MTKSVIAADITEVEDEVANKRRRADPETQAPLVGLHLINNLLGDMLNVTISLLLIEDGMHTTVLSRRWCPLWCCAPLGLINEHMLYNGYQKRLESLSYIPGTHCGPIRGLTMGKSHSNGKDRAKLDKWFLSTALDQLEELTINDGHMCLLPTSALCLTPMLPITRFLNCHFPKIIIDPVLLLPRLKHLELVTVSMPNDDMDRLLHGCTALVYLHVHVING
ncbi:hypothetical protein D1007_42745 [Hordeum vulgare]|nr:hypothetical protein D1007_42745 [Hordeum vulgare]